MSLREVLEYSFKAGASGKRSFVAPARKRTTNRWRLANPARAANSGFGRLEIEAPGGNEAKAARAIPLSLGLRGETQGASM